MGRVGTIDHFVLTSLDQLLLILKKYSFLQKKNILMRRSSVLRLLPLRQGFPAGWIAETHKTAPKRLTDGVNKIFFVY